MNPALLSLVFLLIGLVVGFLAQRSRMCFVAGFRDWILVRDTELLTGLFAFLATVWLLTSVLGSLGVLHRGVPVYGQAAAGVGVAAWGSLPTGVGRFFWSSLGGGFLVGVFSVIAGGCVMRQHVLCAQGDRNALFYLAGFYGAVVVYYGLLSRFFGWVYG
jgi:uncharacterized membrane protein YedE/YeeE